MGLLSFTEITDKAQNTFKRFPVTLLWSIFGTLFCIVVTNNAANDLFDDYLEVLLTLILGVSWLIGTQFFIEQQTNPKRWWPMKLLVLLALFLFWYFFPSNEYDRSPEQFIRFFLFLIAGHLFVFFAPFIKEWNKAAYWNYLKAIGTAIVRSGFFAGVLYIGLVIALVAIDALFDTYIQDRRYLQLFFLCLGTVNTWIYLSDFPRKIRNTTEVRFQKALEVFVKYILIPLVLLYLLILYAYSFKILIQWELPKGWVSYLVTILALLGFIVQIIIDPIQKKIKAWTINRFFPWFYYLMLPLLVLLYIAIFRRILDYGVTENRYFVLLTAFWITSMIGYLLFARNRKLIVLPSSFFMLVILSSFGFWSAFQVSKESQIRRFKKVYENVLSNKKVASSNQINQLKSILNYLDDRKMLSELDPVTGIAMVPAFKDTINDDESYRYNYRWLDTQKVIDSMGITLNPDELGDNPFLYGESYNYYGNHFYNGKSLSIENYDYFSAIQLIRYDEKQNEIGDFYVSYQNNSVSLCFVSKTDSTEQYQVSLREKLLHLKQYNSSLPENRLGEMVLDFKKDRILGKLIFTDLSYQVRKNDSIFLNHSSGYLFLRQ
ncbi:DUF4153 domain-containing protein [Flavobacteriaceae bacterium TP-CH-4]|uniref:DUF4153 domain-containing protein n=1 Tax=Pelagihabitans pacificus TaxID=2696054 RepID=A0A967AWD2_9FLAO|nr:DUF4153 domain-containing protein [Pelagihabitans pacificus]NHF60343.1 DUF4153 domain-containing protein [Pelagihabitans pacificus]